MAMVLSCTCESTKAGQQDHSEPQQRSTMQQPTQWANSYPYEQVTTGSAEQQQVDDDDAHLLATLLSDDG